MKILAIFVAVMILLSVGLIIQPAEGKDALAREVRGYIFESYDGNARLINPDHGMPWNGNITVIQIRDIKTPNGLADQAWNDGTWPAEYFEEGPVTYYNWDAYTESPGNDKYPNKWFNNPNEPGENIIFLAEYQFIDEKDGTRINYTAISNIPAETYTPENPKSNYIKYEPIPKPEINEMADKPIGKDYLNISIPYFKYTDYNAEGEPTRRGNFDTFQSYAVFVVDRERKHFQDWTYLGNSKPDERWNIKAEPPLPANDLHTDPNKINTGRDYFLAENLIPGLEYQFKVRVNFQSTQGDDMGGVWGYGGGLGEPNVKEKINSGKIGGSGTTFASSGGGGWVPTNPGGDPPIVYIENPLNGDYLNYNDVNVKWDGYAPNGLDFYEIRINSGSWIYKGTDYSHTFTGLSEGSYTVEVKIHDDYGSTDTDSVTFTVDITDPNVSITSPVNGDLFAVNQVTIQWTGSDSGSGINYYLINLNGGIWTNKGSSTSHTYSSLTEDTHTVFVRAYDNAGNFKTTSVAFMVDLTAPSLSITEPSGLYINDTTVTVEWEGSDAGSGIDYYEIRLNSGSWTYKGTDTEHTYYSLSESVHTVDVRVFDNAGNHNTNGATFVVDVTDPTIEITSPTSQYIGDTSVTVEWEGSDAGSGIGSYYIRLNSGSWIYKGTDTSHTYSSLSESTHTVYVWVSDKAGNSNMETVSFTVDVTAPTISITSPSDDDIFTTDEVTIQWTGSDSGSGIDYYRIKLNSESWIYKGIATSHTFTGLSEREHTVYVEAYDNAGNSEIDSVTFTVANSNIIQLTYTSNSGGWNLFSTRLIPLDTSLTAILDDPVNGIPGSYSKVMYYDASNGQWKSYVPGRASHFNNLDTWDRTMGIWIQMTENATLIIKGDEPVTTDITIYPGWNMVGYPSLIDGNNNLPNEVSIVGYFDASEEYNIIYDYEPNIFKFQPGNGYWIYNVEEYSVIWTIIYDVD